VHSHNMCASELDGDGTRRTFTAAGTPGFPSNWRRARMPEPVLVLEPPYELCRAPDGVPPALGAILVGDLTGDEPSAVKAARMIVQLHAEAPWCPVCIVIGPQVSNGPVVEALEPLDG